jgi:hypothetical protein
MREYAVLLPLRHLEVGVPIDRAAWPLHVTIQSNVRTSAHPEVVIAAVQKCAQLLSPLTGMVGEEARFGPDGAVLVDLVASVDLRRAHDAINAALRQDAAVVPVVPAFDGDGYQPHITATAQGRARRGDPLDLRTLVLVEIGPGGDTRIALPVASFDLGPRAGEHPR